jgi:hypothetical protein
MVDRITRDARALRLARTGAARTDPANMMGKPTAYFCRAFS